MCKMWHELGSKLAKDWLKVGKSVRKLAKDWPSLKEGKRRPPPTLSALLRAWPVLLRADFVLAKDPKSSVEGRRNPPTVKQAIFLVRLKVCTQGSFPLFLGGPASSKLFPLHE